MNLIRSLSACLCATLLYACASNPPPPEWQANAHSALKGFSAAYLSGNARLSDVEFTRAKTELARTGRADLLARAELTRCAVRVASLEFDQCPGYAALAQDAGPAEQSYAAYLSGHWATLSPALLPAHHAALLAKTLSQGRVVKAPNQSNQSNLLAMDDPLARLIAAGVLLQTGHLTPADIAVAVDAASAQGWRRPLLAWLGVQLQHAQEAGAQGESVARIQRRIELVLQSGSPVR